MYYVTATIANTIRLLPVTPAFKQIHQQNERVYTYC